MSTPVATQSQDGTHDMMLWVLAMVEKINQTGKLAPAKAIQKRLQEMINIYSSARLWEALKQFSIGLGMNNASLMEDIFHKCPELPDLFETDKALHEALNRWFEQKAEDVARFHKVSSAMLRANPVIEWEIEPLSNTNKDFRPIMDMLFRNTEGIR